MKWIPFYLFIKVIVYKGWSSQIAKSIAIEIDNYSIDTCFVTSKQTMQHEHHNWMIEVCVKFNESFRGSQDLHNIKTIQQYLIRLLTLWLLFDVSISVTIRFQFLYILCLQQCCYKKMIFTERHFVKILWEFLRDAG